MTFKKGEKAILKMKPTKGQYQVYSETGDIEECTIVSERKESGGGVYYYEVKWDNGQQEGVYEVDLLKTNKNKKMSLKENFTLAFKSEPDKSFRKAGITNGDDFLTEEGQHIFLSWLLKKYGADFKKEVVDGLLEEKKREEESK